MSERCSWCGEAVEADDGLRAYEPAGARTAVFCRLEHVVPWEMQGPHWEADSIDAQGGPGPVSGADALRGNDAPEEPPFDSDAECVHCGAELGDTRVLLVRHRGEHRIADGFCNADHMAAWAKAGGPWAS